MAQGGHLLMHFLSALHHALSRIETDDRWQGRFGAAPFLGPLSLGPSPMADVPIGTTSVRRARCATTGSPWRWQSDTTRMAPMWLGETSPPPARSRRADPDGQRCPAKGWTRPSRSCLDSALATATVLDIWHALYI